MGLEGSHQAVDIGVRGWSGPPRLGGEDGCSEVTQQAVGHLLGLHFVQLGLALLGGVLGHGAGRRRLRLYLVEQSHQLILSIRCRTSIACKAAACSP
jgi:hypothetical protein